MHTLVAREFRLRELLDSVVDVLGPQAQAKGLSLTVEDLPRGLDALIGDRDHVAQVLINLVANAIKFTHQGGVTLRISKELETDTCVVLTWHVVDTGVGMTQEASARIFESFAQADEDTRRRYGGTGLGTAIAKELVERMEGQIGVDSVPCKGSRFWFTLGFGRVRHAEDDSLVALDVISAPTSPMLTASHIPPEASTPRGRILVVEDNPANRKVVTKILELGGYEVDVADSGPSALLNVACEKYDLLLLDMELPGFGGLDLLARLRARFGDDVRALMLTANATSEARELCLAAGATGFLTKPISARAFLATIESILPATGRFQAEKWDGALVSTARLKEQLALGKELAFVLELVDLWREDADKTLPELEQAINNRDAAQARKHLHVLEGGASELGACALIESCRQLRTLVCDAAAYEWHDAMDQLRGTYERTCKVFDGLASLASSPLRPSMSTQP